MNAKFVVVPISELQVKLPKLKRQVQMGHRRLVVTCCGEAVGFLLPLSDVSLKSGISIDCWREISLPQFCRQLTEATKLVESDVDCIYLTFHTRRIIAFVGRRFTSHLPIPIIALSQL